MAPRVSSPAPAQPVLGEADSPPVHSATAGALRADQNDKAADGHVDGAEVRDLLVEERRGAAPDPRPRDATAGLTAPDGAGVGLKPKRGVLASSILNEAGRNNVAGADPLWNNLASGDTRLSRRDAAAGDGNRVADPNAVMRRNNGAGVSPEIQTMVRNGVGAPKTAELVAAKLAELYGPFNASNSPANRQAIITNLMWIADTSTGLQYEHNRAEANSNDTYAPNVTLSNRKGVCRDIHTATSALLSSLLNAHFDSGAGKWVPGAASGQEGNVQTISFNNPSEFHAYMVYRDPATGRWNALEYGKHYDLQSANALDAFGNLPGYLAGYQRYTLRGWDKNPVVTDRGAIGAARANAFFEGDVGTGSKGEVRVQASHTNLEGAVFLAPRLALVGSVDPSALDNGLRGGIKLNYHDDLVSADAKGYVHYAGGVYTDFFDASQYTGQRGAADRARYKVTVLAIQADGRHEKNPHQLIGQHLQAKWGADYNMRLGLPLGSGPNVASPLMVGGLVDYSAADVGLDGALLGREQLSDRLSLDWMVQLRGEVDLMQLGVEAVTSGAQSVERSLGKDLLQTDFAMALTHQGEGGMVTRFEVGGSQFLHQPYDSETTAQASHYASFFISPASGTVNFGVLAKGETLDGKTIPVNALGIALSLQPSKNISIGFGIDANKPNDGFSSLSDHVSYSGSVNFKF